MLKQIEDLISQNKLEEALECISQMKDASEDILALKGQCQQELGQYGEALQTYQQLIQSNPADPEVWLSLSEVQDGEESKQSLLKGIELSQDAEAISNAYCSLVELYMSDLCDEADAELQCEQYIAKGVMVCPSNPEVWMTLASLRFTQQRYDEAVEAVSRQLQLWLPRDILEECEGLVITDEVNDLQDIPSYDSRLNTAKLLIEMKLFDVALVVLQTCTDENDQDFEVPYLKALVFWTVGLEFAAGVQEEEDLDAFADRLVEDDNLSTHVLNNEDVAAAWSDAKEAIEESRQLVEQHSVYDSDLVESVQNLYAMIFKFQAGEVER